ncbi:hypothetical protein DPMN_146185 [Dreissena polymorpha]|uniref:Sushi domain-containing protein n=1 Tax=Dreissena polymorpha TaxID=45954 RepID=A0A9D4F9U8_DREPO|nr:hypothetical protein DPMN_146185 [Dreissena polymorpha]
MTFLNNNLFLHNFRWSNIYHGTIVNPDPSIFSKGQTCACEPLPEAANGKVFVENVNFGAVARCVCDTGYKPRGDQARVCQGDEKWSGVAPQCLLDYDIGQNSLTIM